MRSTCATGRRIATRYSCWLLLPPPPFQTSVSLPIINPVSICPVCSPRLQVEPVPQHARLHPAAQRQPGGVCSGVRAVWHRARKGGSADSLASRWPHPIPPPPLTGLSPGVGQARDVTAAAPTHASPPATSTRLVALQLRCALQGATVYREWCPGATEAQLIGDFNNWQGGDMQRDDFGTWTLRLPDGQLACAAAAAAAAAVGSSGSGGSSRDAWQPDRRSLGRLAPSSCALLRLADGPAAALPAPSTPSTPWSPPPAQGPTAPPPSPMAAG